jgi:rhamnosyltransferase
LVTATTFDVAGLMDEDFFIDYVDLEWCLRCKAHAIPIYVKPDVMMTHSVGMRSVRLGPITTFIHSPARTYYKVRNPFLLLRKPSVRLPYALKEIASVVVHHTIQLIFFGQRRQYARAVLSGLRDGVLGRVGKRLA